jgi:hypothetical protein
MSRWMLVGTVVVDADSPEQALRHIGSALTDAARPHKRPRDNGVRLCDLTLREIDPEEPDAADIR